jgi:DNA-binding transcriptional ArsR family regulator
MTPRTTTPKPRAADRRLAKAMSHPTRLRLLGLLNEGVASPKALAERIGQPIENIAYHMRVLRELGCIELVRTERRRGATVHYYRALTRAFIDDEGWALVDSDSRAAVSSTVLQEAFALAFEAIAAGTFDDRDDRHLSLSNLTLTEDGWRELNSALEAAVELALKLQADAMAPETVGDLKVSSDLLIAHFTAPRSTLVGPTDPV